MFKGGEGMGIAAQNFENAMQILFNAVNAVAFCVVIAVIYIMKRRK